MKEEYAENKIQEITKGQIYACMICQKRFKSTEFVNKHIFNKHDDVLKQKFNKSRFDEMLKENYMNDPNKFTNNYVSGGPGGSSSYQSGGGYGNRSGHDRRGNDHYRGGRYGGDHGGNRYDRGGDRDRDDRKRKEYVDYDDPQLNAKVANPDRQIVSYDDLF